MFEWLDQINLFLHAHPHWIPKLMFLLRLKIGLLCLLMGYFLYRIYQEQPRSTRTTPLRARKPAPTHFVA